MIPTSWGCIGGALAAGSSEVVCSAQSPRADASTGYTPRTGFRRRHRLQLAEYAGGAIRSGLQCPESRTETINFSMF